MFFKRKCVYVVGFFNLYYIIVILIEIRMKKEYYIVSICMYIILKYNK